MEHKLTFVEYNEALKGNQLLGMKCGSCGAVMAQPRIACGKCNSADMSVINLKGSGSIQTFTMANVAPEGREAECPYFIVLVELTEGPWIMGNLSGIKPEEATMDIIGKRVTMERAVPYSDKYSAGDLVRPIFRLDESQA
jgi:uncharacterized OB-fold protein